MGSKTNGPSSAASRRSKPYQTRNEFVRIVIDQTFRAKSKKDVGLFLNISVHTLSRIRSE